MEPEGIETTDVTIADVNGDEVPDMVLGAELGAQLFH